MKPLVLNCGLALSLIPLLLLGGGCVVEQVCYSDEDCPTEQRCDASQGCCIDRNLPCTSDADCLENFVCEDGACVPDSSGPLNCPEGMVSIADAYCMDIYEASRPDATESDPGSDESRATSRAGVIPWFVKPMSAQSLEDFTEACEAAGKHICSPQEWAHACTGSNSNLYVFGSEFDRETCNCVDTFCDDYCEEHEISDCVLSDNCGYTYDCFHVTPTGSYPDCIDEWGVLDICGNVWEVVPSSQDGRGYEVRGGAFNCAGARDRLMCSYNASWTDLYAGFRCCWTPSDGD